MERGLKLLKIESAKGVDQVIIVVPEHYDEAEMLQMARDSADMRGEVYISCIVDLPGDLEMDTERPFVG